MLQQNLMYFEWVRGADRRTKAVCEAKAGEVDNKSVGCWCAYNVSKGQIAISWFGWCVPWVGRARARQAV